MPPQEGFKPAASRAPRKAEEAQELEGSEILVENKRRKEAIEGLKDTSKEAVPREAANDNSRLRLIEKEEKASTLPEIQHGNEADIIKRWKEGLDELEEVAPRGKAKKEAAPKTDAEYLIEKSEEYTESLGKSKRKEKTADATIAPDTEPVAKKTKKEAAPVETPKPKTEEEPEKKPKAPKAAPAKEVPEKVQEKNKEQKAESPLQQAERELALKRDRYAELKRELAKKEGDSGRLARIKRALKAYKGENDQSPELVALRATYQEAERNYFDAQVTMGRAMTNEEEARLRKLGFDDNKIRQFLTDYRAMTVLDRVVFEEEELLEAKLQSLEPKTESGFLKRSWEWYSKQNKHVRALATATLITGAAAATVGTALAVAVFGRRLSGAYGAIGGAALGVMMAKGYEKVRKEKGDKIFAAQEESLRAHVRERGDVEVFGLAAAREIAKNKKKFERTTERRKKGIVLGSAVVGGVAGGNVSEALAAVDPSIYNARTGAVPPESRGVRGGGVAESSPRSAPAEDLRTNTPDDLMPGESGARDNGYSPEMREDDIDRGRPNSDRVFRPAEDGDLRRPGSARPIVGDMRPNTPDDLMPQEGPSSQTSVAELREDNIDRGNPNEGNGGNGHTETESSSAEMREDDIDRGRPPVIHEVAKGEKNFGAVFKNELKARYGGVLGERAGAYTNFTENVRKHVEGMPAEERTAFVKNELGIKSGRLDLIQPGEKINLSAFFNNQEFMDKNLARATGLSESQLSSIENYRAPRGAGIAQGVAEKPFESGRDNLGTTEEAAFVPNDIQVGKAVDSWVKEEFGSKWYKPWANEFEWKAGKELNAARVLAFEGEYGGPGGRDNVPNFGNVGQTSMSASNFDKLKNALSDLRAETSISPNSGETVEEFVERAIKAKISKNTI